MRIKAILAGLGTWFLMSVVFGLLYALKTYFTYINPIPYDSEGVFTEVSNYFLELVRLLIFVIVGYVTARVAKKNEIRHGIVIGIITWICSWSVTFFIAYIMRSTRLQDEDYFNFIAISYSLLTVLCCILGSFIQKRIQDKKGEQNNSLETNIDLLGKQ